MNKMSGPEAGHDFPCVSLDQGLPHLRRPPAAEAVHFKIQNTAGDHAQIAAYLDARLVFDRYRVRWREAGRGSRQRSRTFARKKDADIFEAEVKRRRALGELTLLEAGNKQVRELAERWWATYALPNLAD
jgi:hypothetical protein